MPTDQYRCTACGNGFEEFREITDDPIAVCPECGGAVEKLLGPGGGILLNGP